jgi:hypothetical protein
MQSGNTGICNSGEWRMVAERGGRSGRSGNVSRLLTYLIPCQAVHRCTDCGLQVGAYIVRLSASHRKKGCEADGH